tara:strand:+ start:622 stop:1368 length:747 start_codon:yes stop_codon:yes gene_type:complete
MPKSKENDIKKEIKKVVKKKKRKVYFGQEVQDAIVRYNQSDVPSERNKIYRDEIHRAFDKLCENIINTFKFTYFDYGFEDVKCETVAFLVMNMHKYDHTKGSKAFSYFSIVAKNYLILHNNANYKKYKTHDDIKIMDRNSSWRRDNNKEDLETFTDEFAEYLKNNIHTIFRKKRDIDVAYSILELMERRREIENFNKKALYIMIREMTDVDTTHITKVTNTLKKHYKNMLNRYWKQGTITDDKQNPFF